MSDRLQRLAEDRAARNAAREIFNANLKNVVGDLEARGIGERIAGRATREVRELADQALDVAKNSKGVIAGTVAALTLWLLRRPLIAWINGWFGEETEPDIQPSDSDEAA
jgi:hypothetical protein